MSYYFCTNFVDQKWLLKGFQFVEKQWKTNSILKNLLLCESAWKNSFLCLAKVGEKRKQVHLSFSPVFFCFCSYFFGDGQKRTKTILTLKWPGLWNFANFPSWRMIWFINCDEATKVLWIYNIMMTKQMKIVGISALWGKWDNDETDKSDNRAEVFLGLRGKIKEL